MSEQPNYQLVATFEDVEKPVQAAFGEGASAKYLNMSRTRFLGLVTIGIIPWTTHHGGSRRLYLKTDLDIYLASLPKHRMLSREGSPRPALKGVGKK